MRRTYRIVLVLTLFLITWYLLTRVESDCDKHEIFIHPNLRVLRSNKGGFGVFTNKSIPEGTIIEKSRTLILNPEERRLTDSLHLYDFQLDEDKTCLCLGFGSMYNHCSNNNVDYYFNDGVMMYVANRNISPNEELFINYGPDYFLSNGIQEL